MRLKYVPQDSIPPGDETDRLHRWGYTRYAEMFDARQLMGLELSARLIAKVKNASVHAALATNLSDLLRYQNMLCRYDTMALKSLDIFSVHGFPVGLTQCESNLLGVLNPRTKACIGSGGWANVIGKFTKAKLYCAKPFEVRYHQGHKEIVPIDGEWIGSVPNGTSDTVRIVDLRCSDAGTVEIPPSSFDAVLTDPPYFGNVQYAELMDFCYVWLRQLLKGTTPGFSKPSTRDPQELTANEDMGRGLAHFADGLSAVFRKMARGLKSGGPLVFTYHHNDLSAYYPLAVAVLDAGLTCSASLPCPAEMSASIHINGTGSSIIDTVFVCRATGACPAKWIASGPKQLASVVKQDLAMLKTGGVRPTARRHTVHHVRPSDTPRNMVSPRRMGRRRRNNESRLKNRSLDFRLWRFSDSRGSLRPGHSSASRRTIIRETCPQREGRDPACRPILLKCPTRRSSRTWISTLRRSFLAWNQNS